MYEKPMKISNIRELISLKKHLGMRIQIRQSDVDQRQTGSRLET